MYRTCFTDVRRFASVDSTNRYLLDEARAGAPEGVVAVADHQTAGRGRLGRRWASPPGVSLLASVLMRPVLPPSQRYLCTAAVALAAAEACEAVAGVDPGLKWPNDLMVDDRKLAGVLAESDSDAPGGGPGSVAVVVGIGLNVMWPGPPEVAGTCLRDLAGRAVAPDELLERLLDRLESSRQDLDTPAGRAAMSARARERCVTLGRRVRVAIADDMFEGTAVALTDEGHLVVATADGRREVAAGELTHLRAHHGGIVRGE